MEIWKRNLLLMWIAQFIAMLGMNMVVPFLPFFIRELGISEQNLLERWSGLVFAGPFIMAFIMTPVWGSLADKYGKKAMTLRAIFGLSVSQLLIGFSGNIWHLFAFRMLQGVVSGFLAAALALVSAGTPKEKSGYAISILQSSLFTGAIAGPLAGGLLADFISYRSVFFIVAGLCFASGLFILIYVREPAKKDTNGRLFSIFSNIRYVISEKEIKFALLIIAIVQISVTVTNPIFALFIETFEMDTAFMSTYTGVSFGVTGISAAIASPWWGRRFDKKGFSKNMFIAMNLSAAAFALHTISGNYFLLLPIRILLGLSLGGIIPGFYSLINKHSPEERNAGIMGLASSSNLLGGMAGPLLCVLLTLWMKISFIFLFPGIILTIISFLMKNKIKE